MTALTADEMKRAAAARSLDFVEDGMLLGLGTGSTAAHMVDLLGQRVKEGFKVTGIPTSEATRAQAEKLGIPLTSFDKVSRLDLTIDGADEADARLRLIKGGGGALLREKIVAFLSDRMVVIADAGKKVDRLGAFPLPVEVIPFAAPALMGKLEALGCAPTLRPGGEGAPFRTDEGHQIIDCAFGVIEDPEALAATLDAMPGVVDHGLFIGLASTLIFGGPDGVEVIGEGA